MLLPDELFTLKSMESIQNFIDAYGTHYVKAASFGGQFYIRVVSTSNKFETVDRFNEAADAEIQGMTGVAKNKNTKQ